jgi:hypothetical protein
MLRAIVLDKTTVLVHAPTAPVNTASQVLRQVHRCTGVGRLGQCVWVHRYTMSNQSGD